MNANRADFPIAAMARVLGVSESGYLAWGTVGNFVCERT